MANHYELLTIIGGRIADSDLEGFCATLESVLKKYVSQIHYLHNLGRRKLTYAIKHQGYGTYILCEFDAEGDGIKKLDRALTLTTELLRHCIVRRKTIGTPSPLERREEEPRLRSGSERTPRKTQDDELLGTVPLTPAAAPVIPSVPSATPPNVTPTDDTVVAMPQTVEEVQETTQTEEGAKKKGGKVSYEELDKKLNELLSDDII